MTNLGIGSRKGLTDGLREFIKVELRRCTGTFKVRKPKVPEWGSDVTVRERPDKLTFRSGEVKSSKALIDVNHIEPERWDADWFASWQALYKGIEGQYSE